MEVITADDELHWTGRQLNWNYMCADCHTTDLKKGYNASTDTFNTTWSDINVGCESCHGPGQNHLQWAGQSGDAIAAEKAYRQAIKLEPDFGPAYANLADLYRAQGLEKNAGKVLNDGIKQMPENAALYFSLGLLQVRSKQLQPALTSLQKAAELTPEIARYTYVYGVALNSDGQTANALEVLTEGNGNNPRDQQIIYMVASIYRDQGNKEQAIKWAQKLLEINPADQNAEQFIESLESKP